VSKKRKKNAYLAYLEFTGVRLVMTLVRIAPWKLALGVARIIGYVIYMVDSRHRKIADDNLMAAYGDDLSASERDTIVRGAFRRFAELGVEAIHMYRYAESEAWREHVRFDVPPEVWDIMRGPRGAIVVGAHFGNMDVTASGFSLAGVAGLAVVRPMDNPLLDKLLTDFRSRSGIELIPHHGVFHRMQEALEAGINVGLLVDQDAKRNAVFVPFFGRPAATTSSPAVLSLRTGCPIIILYGFREGDMPIFRVVTDGPIYPSPTGDLEADVYRITADMTSRIEKTIRRYPDQWLWMHRRWKTQPPPDWSPPPGWSLPLGASAPASPSAQPKTSDEEPVA